MITPLYFGNEIPIFGLIYLVRLPGIKLFIFFEHIDVDCKRSSLKVPIKLYEFITGQIEKKVMADGL